MTRYACLFFVLFLFSSIASFAQMKVTVYDDGKACPGECDSHVVFHSTHNGTINAFVPSSTASNPSPCKKGLECRICFSNNKNSCINITYRGSGPPKNRFDFTPSFFLENCNNSSLPTELSKKCKELNRTVKVLEGRVNCFEKPKHKKCNALMEMAKKRKETDEPLYAECKSLGLYSFNTKYQTKPKLQRSLDCNYSAQRKTLPNGTRYRPLLDGACREGTYVGRNGFDCCSGNLFQSSIDFTECSVFFPKP